MVSINITTAFKVHGVVGFVFTLPVFIIGLRGFIEITSEGKLTPDEWHMSIFGIDFAKNMMIAMQCYAGTKMVFESQKLLAYTMVAMCIMAIINLIVNPVGDGKPPLPAVAYLCLVPAVYIYALKTDTGVRTKAPVTKRASKSPARETPSNSPRVAQSPGKDRASRSKSPASKKK